MRKKYKLMNLTNFIHFTLLFNLFLTIFNANMRNYYSTQKWNSTFLREIKFANDCAQSAIFSAKKKRNENIFRFLLQELSKSFANERQILRRKT